MVVLGHRACSNGAQKQSMRPKFVIFLFVVVMLMLAIVYWRWPTKTTTNAPLAVVPGTNTQAPGTNFPAKIVPPGGSTSAPTMSTAEPNPTISNKPGIQDVTEQFVQSKNRPIDFCGQVIDQDSNAISGAKIRIGITQLTIPDPLVPELGAKTIQLEQTSDSAGRFEFHGQTGEGFGVQITKAGYDIDQNKYDFGPTAGSHDNPVVFKMWSTNIHEQLITGSKVYDIVPDGRPYFLNFTDGTVASSGTGDLKVWLKRPDPITYGKRFSWACEVDAINGGELLQETDISTSMYQAPTNGYTTSFNFKQDADANGWGDTTGVQRFYVRLNDGNKYGRITIELEAYHNDQTPSLMRFSYAINPSGSQILR